MSSTEIVAPKSEPTPKAAELTPAQAAGLVARVVELELVRLADLSIQAGSLDALLGGDAVWQLGKPSVQIMPNEPTRTLDVKVQLALDAVVTVPESESSGAPSSAVLRSIEKLASIQVTLELRYRFTKEFPPEEIRTALFRGFADLNGVHNAWPYMRELVQNVTMRMGIPPLTLPSFKVPREPKKAP